MGFAAGARRGPFALQVASRRTEFASSWTRLTDASVGGHPTSMPLPPPRRTPLVFTADVEPSPPPQGFSERCRGFEIALGRPALDTLGHFLALLLANNAKLNLTAINDLHTAWTRHIFDALTLLPTLAGQSMPGPVVDLGSGGGVPGVPLAIAQPHRDFHLVESTEKKAAFLRWVSDRLGLKNVHVWPERAEAMGRSAGHRERYDMVIARALGPLRVLLELSLPLARVGGHCAFIKGARAPIELEEARVAMELLHAIHLDTQHTPTGTLVLFEKLKPTPPRYPRGPGMPKRSPL